MTQPSLQLTVQDFDAYLPERATSKAYSRPRLELKQRALSWGRRVAHRLGELGISVDLHASDEHPSLRNKHRVDCQWVFFWRDLEAREELDRLLEQGRSMADVIDDPSPFTRHAFLGLRLDSRVVEVCFAVHPNAKVDMDNLRARLDASQGGSSSELAEELARALRDLPEEFMIGIGASDSLAMTDATRRVQCGQATTEVIFDLLKQAVVESIPLWVGWSVSRETAIEHASLLSEQLEDALVALSPTYELIAWSRENDRIALDKRLEGAEQARAKTHAEAQAETERWQAEQALLREKSQELAKARLEEGRSLTDHRGAAGSRKPSLATLFKAPAPKGKVRALDDAFAARKSEVIDSSLETSLETADAELTSPSPGSAGTLDKGSRVRVLRGPFADKLGVIGDLDAKGSARVLLGLLSTRLDLGDLEPVVEGKDRPNIQSSHRRLSPPPRKAR